jgi:hypothetical protein
MTGADVLKGWVTGRSVSRNSYVAQTVSLASTEDQLLTYRFGAW